MKDERCVSISASINQPSQVPARTERVMIHVLQKFNRQKFNRLYCQRGLIICNNQKPEVICLDTVYEIWLTFMNLDGSY